MLMGWMRITGQNVQPQWLLLRHRLIACISVVSWHRRVLLKNLCATVAAGLSLPSSGVTVASPATTLPFSESSDPSPFTRYNKAVCGPNAIYLLLSLQSLEVPHDHIMQRVRVGPTGMSLVEMREACSSFGLSTEVRRLDKGSVAALAKTLPVVAHLGEGDRTTGHYVVVISATTDRVKYLDGTSGQAVEMDVDRFGALWSGHVLVPSEAGDGCIISLAALIVFLICMRSFAARLLVASRWQSRLCSPRGSKRCL
jgi:hypothetical protein